MQPKSDWIRFSLLVLVGIVGGWAAANAPIEDVRLQIVFIMLLGALEVIAIVVIGRLGRRGPGLRLCVRRTAWVIVLFALVAGAGYLIYMRAPVGSWALVVIAVLGLVVVLLRNRWASSGKIPPRAPPGGPEG